MHDYSAQALDAPVAESWVDCKENRQCMAAKGPLFGRVAIFQASPNIAFLEAFVNHQNRKLSRRPEAVVCDPDHQKTAVFVSKEAVFRENPAGKGSLWTAAGGHPAESAKYFSKIQEQVLHFS